MWITSDLANAIKAWDRLTNSDRRRVCRKLRQLGFTYSEIVGVVPVPRGTLSAWVRDIELTPEQIENVRLRTSQKGKPRDTQRKRREETQRIRHEAAGTALELIANPYWTAGVALYWAEGGKSKRGLQMSNADPRVLQLFMSWCREFHDTNARFVAALNVHNGNDVEAAHRHWGRQLSLRPDDFNKPYVKKEGTGHRKNRLPHGVCNLIMRRSVDAWIRTMTWIDVMAESDWPEHSARSTLTPGR